MKVKPANLKILLYVSATFSFAAMSVPAWADNISEMGIPCRVPGAKMVKPAIGKAEYDTIRMASVTRSGVAQSRENNVGRLRRLVQDTIDDLNYSISIAAEDINRQNAVIESMALLEPPKREFDIRNLLDWYYRYSDWNKDMVGTCEDLLETLSIHSGNEESPAGLYADLAAGSRSAELELQGMVRKHDAELRKLFLIIDRRKLLNDRLQDLRNQLSGLEGKMRGQRPRTPEREQGEKKVDNIKKRISVTQTELVSLFDIKEELLKHYAVMIETGRDEAFRLDLKRGEYEILRDVSGVIGKGGPKNAPLLEAAYRRLIRNYESEVSRIGRKMEELDRKRSGISPAGSFRDLDRSMDLSDFYRDRQQRYADYVNRLKVRIGSLEAEISGVASK